MSEAEHSTRNPEPRSFLSCATAVARLLGVEDGAATEPNERQARRLASAVRKPLLERGFLPEELFAPLISAAVYDPDPSFCRWFVEPAVYAFGRRRVMAALVDHLRNGTDAERAGALRAWYSAHVPLRAERSPAYGHGGVRDPALDRSRDVREAWLAACLHVFAETTDLRVRHRVLLDLPTSRGLPATTARTAREHSRIGPSRSRPAHPSLGRRRSRPVAPWWRRQRTGSLKAAQG
ncbi:hypothetical protein [Streptomyces sp. NPDC051921]|uniref:hypothetical protein n=1 Tax=Streptomyces sp. NPDC051921 TaxID=3155806 RepID=UPI003428E5F8